MPAPRELRWVEGWLVAQVHPAGVEGGSVRASPAPLPDLGDQHPGPEVLGGHRREPVVRADDRSAVGDATADDDASAEGGDVGQGAAHGRSPFSPNGERWTARAILHGLFILCQIIQK